MQSTNGFMLIFVVAGHRYLSVLLLPANLSMLELFRKRKDESWEKVCRGQEALGVKVGGERGCK